jgi:hypothetical protein
MALMSTSRPTQDPVPSPLASTSAWFLRDGRDRWPTPPWP